MTRCELVWTTAGTNRVCSRCLALKGSVVGHTDEVGVTLPPLHPRCRCAIAYREVGFRFDVQRFGTYEEQVQSHGGSGKIKPDRVVEGHERPTISEPLSIIDHVGKNGKIDKRAFYNEEGKLYFEVHATNHNFPKAHPFGEKGEHSHEVLWQDGHVKWAKGKELTKQERKDNGDIL